MVLVVTSTVAQSCQCSSGPGRPAAGPGVGPQWPAPAVSPCWLGRASWRQSFTADSELESACQYEPARLSRLRVTGTGPEAETRMSLPASRREAETRMSLAGSGSRPLPVRPKLAGGLSGLNGCCDSC